MFPMNMNDGDPVRAMLSGLDPSTEKGREGAVLLAEEFRRAENVRHGSVATLQRAYEDVKGDDDERAVGQAAFDFIHEIASAEVRYQRAMQQALFKFVEHLTDGRIDRNMIDRVQQSARNVAEHPEIQRLVEEGEGEIANVEVSTRPDAVTRVRALDDDGNEVRDTFYILPDGTTTDEEPEFDGDRLRRYAMREEAPSGDSVIEGIDLSQTIDPDAEGIRQIRDFDGGVE